MKQLKVLYPGRFQPFSMHHYNVYKWAKNKFGTCTILTSNKTDSEKSPLSYTEKHDVITKLFGINGNNIKQLVGSSYKFHETLPNMDKTVVIYIVGEKDLDRIKITPTSYFQKYDDGMDVNDMYTCDKHGYLVIAPLVNINVPGYGQLSGTTTRKILSDTSKTTSEILQICKKYIFKIYNEKLILFLITKFQDMKKLQEGGSAGHMKHVYDLQDVVSGDDLINKFKLVANVLNTEDIETSIKIDGVNTSIRLADTPTKQFVLDRGSNKELDVKRVTKDTLSARFGDGHVMIGKVGELLDIMNSNMKSIQPELKQLGIWDNPWRFLNIEYVDATTNVIKYTQKYIVIHGLFDLPASTDGKKRQKTDVSFNKSVLESLCNKLNSKQTGIIFKHKYEPIVSKEISFNSSLNKIVKLTGKSLNQSLSEIKVKPDANSKIKLDTGDIVTPYARKNFLALHNATNLEDIIPEPKHQKDALEGYLIVLATIYLGDDILQGLDSELGSLTSHEGIVINDPAISSETFKITGSFIIKRYGEFI